MSVGHSVSAAASSQQHVPAIASVGNLSGYNALSTGLDGVVWVGGRESSGRARLARCTGPESCTGASGWTLSTVGSAQPTPLSIARGVDGSIVAVATYGTSMRVFHCGSTLHCTETGWPR